MFIEYDSTNHTYDPDKGGWAYKIVDRDFQETIIMKPASFFVPFCEVYERHYGGDISCVAQEIVRLILFVKISIFGPNAIGYLGIEEDVKANPQLAKYWEEAQKYLTLL